MKNYNVQEMAIGAVILLGVLALVYVAVQVMGVPIPQWVWHVLGIVFVVCVIVTAIKFLTGGGGPTGA